MYSNKDNVNILTVLLVSHGVRHAVVCPGSRNAPIVHNLNECPAITCWPVTDERSAGFQALGICQATGQPVVVCVTSGTALLNVAPAVAEAFYQHQPVVVVSADRPPQWIDQLDGQTLRQPAALSDFVNRSVTLPEPRDEEARWYCNRLVNEALMACRRGGGGPVHINVPITEPLFEMTVGELPRERQISLYTPSTTAVDASLLARFEQSERPMIVVGQLKRGALPAALCRRLNDLGYVVLQERLSGASQTACCLDEAVFLIGDDERFLPDFILYVGDTLVSKRARRFLRRARKAECWLINESGAVHDVLMNLTGVVQARPADVLSQLRGSRSQAFHDLWEAVLEQAIGHRNSYRPPYSQLLAVQLLEARLQLEDPSSEVHYANSTAVRLGNIFASHYIYCNRGVNGIEGSVSAAAGYSLVTERNVYCVTGDLSFFYDQNALWNRNLRGNLRILLLNNGGGGIFYQLNGLRQSAACDGLVAARHHTNAEGICMENNVSYHAVHSAEALESQLETLTCGRSERPVLLEVFTDAVRDAAIYEQYYQSLRIWKENGKR